MFRSKDSIFASFNKLFGETKVLFFSNQGGFETIISQLKFFILLKSLLTNLILDLNLFTLSDFNDKL